MSITRGSSRRVGLGPPSPRGGPRPTLLVVLVLLRSIGSLAGAERPQDGPTFHRPPKPLPAGAVTEDWPTFLGPRHDATSAETKLLKSFPKEGLPRVWEVPRGPGYAAPAVSNGKLIHFHRVADEEVVEALEPETGKRIWRFAYPTEYRDRYGYSEGPRCAPVTDGDLLYTYGAEGKLHCLKLATGEVLWKKDILAEYKLEQNFFGVGAPPLIEGSHVLINVGATPNGPTIAAFDKFTGQLKWSAGKQWGPSYAGMVPATIHGKRRILAFVGGESRPATGGVLSIDPADGRVDFEFPWRAKRFESVNASSPLILPNNRVLISECYGPGGGMIEITPDMQPKLLWQNENFGTHFMTAIEQGGHLYGFHGHGPLDCPLVCVDAATGKDKWRADPEFVETIKTPQGDRKYKLGLNRSQLVKTGDGRTLCLTENGHLLWLDLNPAGYKELDRTWLFASSETWTGPVLSRGLLYVCRNNPDMLTKAPAKLICYDLRGE